MTTRAQPHPALEAAVEKLIETDPSEGRIEWWLICGSSMLRHDFLGLSEKTKFFDIVRLTDNMAGLRNGRRCGLKIRCPKGRAGSTPALGTTLNLRYYKNLLCSPYCLARAAICEMRER